MWTGLAQSRLDEWVDPSKVWAAIGDDDAFWLDAGPDAATGWSWVGVGSLETDNDAPRNTAVRQTDHLPSGPFQGGWVGWLSYDDAAERAGAPRRADPLATPAARWLRAERFVAFDHQKQRAWVFAPAAELRRFSDEVRASSHVQHRGPRHPESSETPGISAHARHRAEEYAELIANCRALIRAGEAYQLCLTTRFSVDGDFDARSVYDQLRSATPAHHGGIVRAGDISLASASPEQFLEVRDGRVRTRPIKGTRPRGENAETDAALAAELQAHPKERAENVMIVDLMRNDLARISQPGTVTVDELLQVESYPAVHQLVSTISGAVADGTTVGAILDVTFPAGSMTGAPKLSAMTHLSELEGAARGIFAGCFGWVGTNGSLDLAMVIRSIVVHPRGAYVGAGGGITWGSVPSEEVAEVGIKARGPLKALGASLPEGW